MNLFVENLPFAVRFHENLLDLLSNTDFLTVFIGNLRVLPLTEPVYVSDLGFFQRKLPLFLDFLKVPLRGLALV